MLLPTPCHSRLSISLWAVTGSELRRQISVLLVDELADLTHAKVPVDALFCNMCVLNFASTCWERETSATLLQASSFQTLSSSLEKLMESVLHHKKKTVTQTLAESFKNISRGIHAECHLTLLVNHGVSCFCLLGLILSICEHTAITQQSPPHARLG